MLKKAIGSLVTVSVVGLCLAAGASASSNVEQTGPASSEFGVSNAAVATGQGASTTGYQFQAGKTTGHASFKQGIKSNLTLTSPGSTTSVAGETGQETSTTAPTHVVQNQVDHTSGIQYEKSFVGGPKLQFQQVQRTSINYSVGVNSVSPR